FLKNGEIQDQVLGAGTSKAALLAKLDALS
ncbi:MAG: thioredoxin, partial [Verrucomicrobiota bacterium]